MKNIPLSGITDKKIYQAVLDAIIDILVYKKTPEVAVKKYFNDKHEHWLFEVGWHTNALMSLTNKHSAETAMIISFAVASRIKERNIDIDAIAKKAIAKMTDEEKEMNQNTAETAVSTIKSMLGIKNDDSSYIG